MREQVKTEKIKERLGRYVDLLQEIDNQKKRLDIMEETYGTPASPNLSGMPKPKGSVSDPVGGAVSKKLDLEEKIKEKEVQEEIEREAIERIIEHLKTANERAVIRLKYFDRLEWSDVTFLLFGDRADYIEKVDIYQDRTYKIHGRALWKMADVLESIEE